MRNRFLRAGLALAVAGAPAARAGTIPGDLALEVALNQTIGSPMVVTHAGDGSGRLFVAGRYGYVWVRAAGAAQVSATPVLDIDALVSIAGEGGLLGLAFDPQHASNRRFYVHYTDNANDSVIARYTMMAGDPNRADPASATVLLRVDQGSQFHKGGSIEFGTDGFLYIAFGDGAEGNGVDDCNRAQSLTPADVIANDSDLDCTSDGGFTGRASSRALMGKLLRIDVANTTPAGANELCAANADGSAPYAIPAGNPFAGATGGAGRCDEIFAFGLRNPFRFGIDDVTGQIFIGDVGESAQEEVDLFDAAQSRNFGWPACEGTLGNCSGTRAPIIVDDRSTGSCAITGGTVYRGAITSLVGAYVFSDYCSGLVRFARDTGGSWTVLPWQAAGQFQHTCFGEDEEGELYLCDVNADRVRRFVSADVDAIFEDGFEGS